MNPLVKDDFILPTVALRGLVVFPEMTLHFDIGRKKSIAEMVKFFKQNYIADDNDFILIGHTNCPEEAHAFGAQIE